MAQQRLCEEDGRKLISITPVGTLPPSLSTPFFSHHLFCFPPPSPLHACCSPEQHFCHILLFASGTQYGNANTMKALFTHFTCTGSTARYKTGACFSTEAAPCTLLVLKSSNAQETPSVQFVVHKTRRNRSVINQNRQPSLHGPHLNTTLFRSDL